VSIELKVTLLMIASGALGYLIDRIIRRSRRTEDEESVVRVLQLRRLLAEEGLSFAEAKQLRAALFTGREIITPAIARALEEGRVPEQEVPDDTVDFGDTTYKMVEGLGKRLDELRSEIELAVADLMEGSPETRRAVIRAAHQAWEDFADKEGAVAYSLWQGGTGAPILRLSTMIALAEHRLSELRLRKAEEDAL
jgi:uncharacterized protein YecT (DUF1311 family)